MQIGELIGELIVGLLKENPLETHARAEGTRRR